MREINDIVLYGKVSSLKNRLELGKEYTQKQIREAIQLIDQLNIVLDRREKGR